MLVSIDGGKTFKEVSEVRVHYPNLEADQLVDLHFTFTSEGVITDLYDEESGCLGSDSSMAIEIADEFLI